MLPMFTPWRIPDRLHRLTAYASLATMGTSVAAITSDRLANLLLASLAVFIPLTTVVMIRDWRRNNKDQQEPRNLRQLNAMLHGSRIDELPPEIQEDLKIRYADYKLNHGPR